MFVKMSRLVAVCGIFLTASLPVLADTVYMQDGSVLQGEIKLLRADKLTLKTEFAGELELPRKLLRAVATDEAMVVRLDDNDEVSGRLLVDGSGALLLLSKEFGTRQLALANITDLRPVDSVSPETAAALARVAELEEEQAKLTEGLWSARLEVGLEGASGNSKNRSLNVHIATLRETKNDRLSLDALVSKASQNNSKTEEEIIGTARLEHDFSKRAFIFGQVEAERDKFEDIDLRFRLTVGPGYFLVRRPDQELKARLGFGYEHATFRSSGNSDNNVIFNLGFDYRLDLWEMFRLTQTVKYIPAVNDSPGKNYRVESVSGAELPLGSADSLWRLRAEYRNDYGNNPEPGVKKLDSAYLLNLVRDFK